MITHLIFDLDDTLYPSTAKMGDGITYRMLAFVADYLKVSFEEGKRLRARDMPQYGTTLEWLMAAHGLKDQESFFAAVHPDDETKDLDYDPNVRPFLENIKQHKVILTNAPREHAERVLDFLNVRDLFDGIIDIRKNDLRGKPYERAYRNALELIHGTVQNTLFLDDAQKYTEGYVRLGGDAVLVGPQQNPFDVKPNLKVPLPPVPGVKHGRTMPIDSIYGLAEILGTVNG